MTDAPIDPTETTGVDGNFDETDQNAIEQERASLMEFIKVLTGDDIMPVGWFTRLCAYALKTYPDKVTYPYIANWAAAVDGGAKAKESGAIAELEDRRVRVSDR